MIKPEDLKQLDDRELKWYLKHITQFHQECLQFDKCYCTAPVFHEHFKELEKMLLNELEQRK